MKKRKNTKNPVATPNDPATLAQKTLERQRQRATRVLLKRRRAKAGQ